MTDPIATSAPTQITIHPAPTVNNGGGGFFAAGDSPSFSDALDVVNPLQHIPIVSSLYRATTGDSIGAGATIAGGALFGGVFGAIAGLASVVFDSATGQSVGGAMLAALHGDTPDPNAQYAGDGCAVHLGDFCGDVKLALRGGREMGATNGEVQVADAIPAAPVADISNDVEEESPATSLAIPSIPANATPPIGPSAAIDPAQQEKDRQVLSLFGGGSPADVSKAYQKADMRQYLKQSATTNVVM